MNTQRTIAGGVWGIWLCLALATGAQPVSAEQGVAGDRYGAVSFPTSVTGPAQAYFERGVAILHSFGWKQAIAQFQAAQALEPDFAMAYWGEALCYNHPLIAERDLENPRAVLNRLAPNRQERLAKAGTPVERGFLAAVDVLFFSPGDTAARRTAYMEEMARLYERFPDNDEVAAFYALSLLSAAGPADGNGHRMNVRAGTIGLAISARNPRHPGAVHYTIHAFDDPIHAPLALPAARVFAEIAAAVSHARHMPSHIFIQLGMWDEVSRSNQSAYDAAVALWEPGDDAGDMVHALDWGQYGDLQRGDHERARTWIARMADIARQNPGQARVEAALPRVRARYVLETGAWATQPVTDQTPDVELLATGLGAVHLGEKDLAERAVAELRKRASAASGGDRSYYAQTGEPLLIMVREVEGMAAVTAGRTETGLELLAEGVSIAEGMRPPNGAPNPLKPAHELYGEALLAAGRADAAAAAFERSLERTPNRPLSLLGLARAHAAAGRTEAAGRFYRALDKVWGARSFPAVAEARAYLAAAGSDGR